MRGLPRRPTTCRVPFPRSTLDISAELRRRSIHAAPSTSIKRDHECQLDVRGWLLSEAGELVQPTNACSEPAFASRRAASAPVPSGYDGSGRAGEAPPANHCINCWMVARYDCQAQDSVGRAIYASHLRSRRFRAAAALDSLMTLSCPFS
jgi:hypothetical protein